MTDQRLNLDGPIIDLVFGAKIMDTNKTAAKKMITIMLKSAETEMKELAAAHKTKNWKMVYEYIHKLHGGVSYFGTPRLQKACEYLEEYLKLKSPPSKELAEALYQQVLQEMEQVKAQHKP
jgi:HPt (histidine-containing phosphotransfer) domain-containing protein